MVYEKINVLEKLVKTAKQHFWKSFKDRYICQNSEKPMNIIINFEKDK